MAVEKDIIPVFVEIIPDHADMEYGKIYISKKYHTAIHLCMCGCGLPTVTPLIKDEWTLTEQDGKISLDPSIGNWKYPCGSHYYIKNNKAII